MFSRVFVGCKRGYGESIKKKIIRMIEYHGLKIVKDAGKADLAILIGGDGTVLRNHSKILCPILGINPGDSVGYYMKSGPKEMKKHIEKLIRGNQGKDYFIHDMMRLETRINGKLLPYLSLNDVLISPIYTRRIFESRLRIGRSSHIEEGSGIIVYTPAGSNAFAHSSGAKNLRYDYPKFGVIEVSPYSGRLKKGEIHADKKISVECLNREGEVCIDGQEDQLRRLRRGDRVSVKKHKVPARIIGFSRRFK